MKQQKFARIFERFPEVQNDLFFLLFGQGSQFLNVLCQIFFNEPAIINGFESSEVGNCHTYLFLIYSDILGTDQVLKFRKILSNTCIHQKADALKFMTQ